MMLGFLLARRGVDVVVLEKHADFLRDLRGDTVHPSTLEVMHELGLLEEFLRRPHQEIRQLGGQIGEERVTIADFSHLPVACPFIALMPQWDFLDFLVEKGRRYPSFHVKMEAEVVDLISETLETTSRREATIVGARVKTREGPLEFRAALTVGADGRHSIVRERAGLIVDDYGVPIDVLWMRLPRRADDSGQTFGYIRDGHIFVMLDRGDYWQCAFVIPKGGYVDLRREGLQTFRETLVGIVPFLRDRVGELTDWEMVKLLTVKVDRLREWARPGLLCIGDAAHAMSPIGGVGINLAVQDAVAAANILANHFKQGGPSLDDLKRVQKRRSFPTRATQRLQLLMQDRVIARTLRGGSPSSLPLFARLLRDHPVLRRLPARVVGLGFRPEHVGEAPTN
jgi:2-polyprenyl-6-methoxyphenol hydroxylase-like FAD-dependent oxidoreductase